jgi:hypothetical protein
LKFKGTKLLIENPTEENIVIFDSMTEFSIKHDGKWELGNETQGGLMITSTVASKDKLEMDLEMELSRIQSDKVKVTIYYANDYESEKSEPQSIIYTKKGE